MTTSTAQIVDRDSLDEAAEPRFAFGKNWARFLTVLNEDRIRAAEQSLRDMLECDSLTGRRFLDIGSGSGLFSLAARRLGAEVRSFDYDADSVNCTGELRRRFFPSDPQWVVSQGSVLDRAFVESLGSFDIVYSWGVLHHTGDMWRAIDIARGVVAPGGKFFIAIYNHTGSQTGRWTRIKRTYVRLPSLLRVPFAVAVSLPGELKSAARAVLQGRPGAYLASWRQGASARGMSHWYDIIDWVGGYPYQAARADEIFDFLRVRGFELSRFRIGGGLGCNEFVFNRPVDATLSALPPQAARVP